MLQYEINSFNDLIGQEDVKNENSLIQRMLKNRFCLNLILYGKAGIGKTTCADLILQTIKKWDGYKIFILDFDPLTNKKEELVDFIKDAKKQKNDPFCLYFVLINEIHNMSKDKQDILLQGLQDNTIFLLATTNQNPKRLNSALISRSVLFALKDVSLNELKTALNHFVKKQYEEGNLKHNENDYKELIDLISNPSDIRKSISNLLIILNLYDEQDELDFNSIKIFLKYNTNNISASNDTISHLKSAFHKSLRGSDVDASLYYLGLLMDVDAYSDIYRRLLCCAYEDVGLAEPSVAAHTMNAVLACEFLGKEESADVLSLITCEIALAPKSNSAYLGLNKAQEIIKLGYNNINEDLKVDSTTYKYVHDYKNHWVEQQYLPNNLKNYQFYFNGNMKNGGSINEDKINTYWKKIKKDEQRDEQKEEQIKVM